MEKVPSNQLKPVEQLAQDLGLQAWKLSGLMAQNNWAAGKVLSQQEFQAALDTWLNMPMSGK